MSQYTICVFAIAKNEEKLVNRWMDAVNEADFVVVTDTGSNDRTVEMLHERGAAVFTETINPWRFDTARNTAMDHIPQEADICVSCDLDEVFEKGWREKLENAWQPFHTQARYLFVASRDEKGNIQKQFVMDKIHRRHGFRWIRPVHETLIYTGEEPGNAVWVDGLVLVHEQDLSKPRGQYLPLLELSAHENPNDDRTAFWLGREYLHYGQYDKCIERMVRYLAMPSATWDEERSAAMRLIATCHLHLEDIDAARRWLYRAIAECPTVREPYVQMARLGYRTGDWPLVYFMVEQGLSIKHKSVSYLLEPDAWGHTLYDLGSIACYRLGLFQTSYDYAKKAAELEPGDVRLENNARLIAHKLQTS